MSQKPKKTWTRPQIVEVPLENEEEVLAACFTASTGAPTYNRCQRPSCART